MVAGLSRITELPGDLQSSLPRVGRSASRQLSATRHAAHPEHGRRGGGGEGVGMGVTRVE